MTRKILSAASTAFVPFFTGSGCHRDQAKSALRSDRYGSPLAVRRDRTLCQRLVEDTDRVGEEGGGKLRSSSTATPTLLRRVNMHDAATHLFVRGLYFSMELRLELPSLPPTAYSHPSMATKSWVLLKRQETTGTSEEETTR